VVVEVPAETAAVLDESLSVQGASTAEAEALGDLPAPDVEPPKRRTRARKPRKSEAVEAVAPAIDGEALASPVDGATVQIDGALVSPINGAASEVIATEPMVEPAAEPELAPEPEARVLEMVAALPTSAEPDPAEISAPPETPRRGWWRRGG
jgi:ribonuclease E